MANKKRRQAGFSLLEMMMVIALVALIAVYYLQEVHRPLREAYATLISYQAGIFNRSINVLRTLSSASKGHYIEHQGTRIFMNEFGWPANTVASMSPHSSNQTAEECRQLWQGIFHNPLRASVSLVGGEKNAQDNSNYKIYSKNHNTCRYQLSGNEEAEYFFDYDLRTGTVVVSGK